MWSYVQSEGKVRLQSQYPSKCFELYRGLQVGWHKFATKSTLLVGILNLKFRACANSRRKFVPTNLQTSVYGHQLILAHVQTFMISVYFQAAWEQG